MDIAPFHPLLVHFPIALLIVAALFDVVAFALKRPDLTAAAFYIQGLGAAGAVASYLSGEAAEEGAERLAKQQPALDVVLERHEDLGKIIMWAALAVVALRLGLHLKAKADGQGVRALTALLSLGLAGLVGLTGYYGGQMVYEHGVGVKAPAGAAAPSRPADHD